MTDELNLNPEEQDELQRLEAEENSGSPPLTLRTNLRSLVDTYYSSQKNRIAWSNRLSALERGVDIQESPKLLQAKNYTKIFHDIERQAFKEINTELESYSVWPWLKTVKGIGPTLAGKLLCDIDIRKAERVSNLWSFAGLGVTVEGKSPRPVKGTKLPYSAKLRTACFMVSRSFLMSKSPYTAIYAAAKEHYTATRMAPYPNPRTGEEMPAWTKGHCDYAARRKMVKIFLQHMWLKWREAEDLPVSQPWIFNNPDPLNPERVHTTYYRPEEFTPEK